MTSPEAQLPNDQFESYYLEKLWELIPPVYRDSDGLEGGDVLRALVKILAEQAAVERRSIDRLWEDQFIDFCDDWAVPYLGDLVGTRMVSSLDDRGRRADVANTIHYRRRAGTLAILEGLTATVTGWEGTVVEEFRHLVRHPHGLDPSPPSVGRVSGTPEHGLPDLRRPRGSQLTWGPWDEYAHLPDARKNAGGLDGRYGITKLALHLYRLSAFTVTNATPHVLAPDADGAQKFTFDPSGRSVPLFQRSSRPDFDTEWRAAREWELPGPIRCEVLGNAEYVVTETLISGWSNDNVITPAQADVLRSIRNLRVMSEAAFRNRLAAFFNPPLGTAAIHRLIADSLVSDCGKGALLRNPAAAVTGDKSSVSVAEPVAGNLQPIPRELTRAGNLSVAALKPDDTRLVIDAENGIGFFTDGAPPAGFSVTYSYGFSGGVGAGTYPRPDLTAVAAGDQHSGGGALAAPAAAAQVQLEIADSATYGPIADLASGDSLLVQAHDGQRPYLALDGDWTFNATTTTAGSKLKLDGLWIGSHAPRTVHLTADAGCHWDSVSIAHATFDPGGTDAGGDALGTVTLSIESTVTTLTIESCIVGPITFDQTGFAETMVLRNTIVQATDPATVVVLTQPRGLLEIDGCTVLGGIHAHQLEASELLCTGLIDVDDLQSGCIRFSAFADGSQVPRAYRSLTLTDTRGLFTSTRLGDPGYAQLSEIAPTTISRGGENGTEIGAFTTLLTPVKLDSLRAKVEEFLPFGLIPLFITET
jgi:hypothetical protein